MFSFATLLSICLTLVRFTAASQDFDADWIAFKGQQGKAYESRAIESGRRTIFEQNKQRVDQFNAEQSEAAGYKLGLNHLLDWSENEMQQLLGIKLLENGEYLLQNSLKAEQFISDILNDDSIEVPDQVDWRKVPGRVTRVKDQGQCGSCWAFATTGALEGQMVARNLSLVELSEQNLVDCSANNDGCAGGWLRFAFESVKDEGGIDDERSYPYEAVNGKCRFKSSRVAFSDTGCALLRGFDEQVLMQTVAKFGPVATAIDAKGDGFRFYKSGIYYNKNCLKLPDQLNHGVLVVGYGTDPKYGEYWIVKNSWGIGYGDEGYIKMARNRNNHCGIATTAFIPTF